MVSDYLNQTRSLKELDALLEKDRLAAATLAELVFNQQVTSAIHNISEVNLVANARIRADCMVTTAKLASDAEICAAQLSANAEIAITEIQKFDAQSKEDRAAIGAAIQEMGQSALSEISTTASSAVDVIKREAEQAIKKISENAKASIEQIQVFASGVEANVLKTAMETKAKLDATKLGPRTPESAVLMAKAAAEKVTTMATVTTGKLKERLETAVQEINSAVDDSLNAVQEIVTNVEARIFDARDSAAQRLQEFLASHLK